MNAFKQKHICILVGSLGGGGAERVVSYLIDHLDNEKFRISLILFRAEGDYLSQLKRKVEIFDLNIKFRSRYDIPSFKIFTRIPRILKQMKPDLVVSFTRFPNVIFMVLKLFGFVNCPTIISQRNNMELDLKHDLLRFTKKIIIKFLYRRADYMLVPAEGLKKQVDVFIKNPPLKIKVIPNLCDLEKVEQLAKVKPDILACRKNKGAVVLSAGRLVEQKDYFSAIKAIAKIKDSIDSYIILGQGPLERHLKNFAAQCGVSDKVIFMGFQRNPYQFMRAADCFLMSSRYEGFGIVLIEAMACGVPIVSTDCSFGPGEIIQSEVNGLLVPVGDDKAIAIAFERVLKDKVLRDKLVQGGLRRVEDFTIERIIPQYEDFFDSVIGQG